MILQALTVLKKDLNGYLKRKLDTETADLVEVSQLIDLDGSVASSDSGKILLTLVNVHQERMSRQPLIKQSNQATPPIDLELEVLISARFERKQYEEALRILSLVIDFFQNKPVFTRENTSSLPAGMNKLTIELLNLDPREMSNFRMATGIKLLPAVLYQLRIVTIGEERVTEIRPRIEGVGDSPKAEK